MRITFEDLQWVNHIEVHWNCLYQTGNTSLSISGLCSNNNDSIWHCFRHITTFTVYVTGCDLEKSVLVNS